MPFAVALGIAAVLTPLVAGAASRAGLVDRPAPDPLKIHARPVPLSGGIAVTLATVGAVALVRWPAWPSWAVVAAIGATLALGVVDDLRPLPAWPRVGLLVAIGGILAAAGVHLGPEGVWGAAGAVLVTVASANAVNIMDGQDGLAGGLGAISAVALAGLSSLAGDPDAAVLALALAGGLAGFLLWNRPPAKVFLGNGGAYAVGVALAVLAARVTAEDGWRGLMAAGVALGVFAFEVAFSAARRLRSGSLMRGDREHSYDLLSAHIGDRRRATLIFWGLGGTCALLSVAVGTASMLAAALLTALVVATFTLGGLRLWARTAGVRRP